MKLTEALKATQAPPPPGARPFFVGLVCGFTANHLQLFLLDPAGGGQRLRPLTLTG